MFETLAGDDISGALKNGRLSDQVQWRFTEQPCWACVAGLPGKNINGTVDSCEGHDASGFLRCGRRHGSKRIVGANAAQVCSQQFDSCKQVDKVAKKLGEKNSN